MGLVIIDEFNSFEKVRNISVATVLDEVKRTIATLDEREELEPFIRAIISDPNETPHGPAEIVDILTHRVKLRSNSQIAAFLLKGKSFPTVRSKHVSHQIYRLEKIAGLGVAVLAAVGTIMDDAKEEFCSTAERLNLDYAIFDKVDLARLFIAYGFLCPRDGRRIRAGRCACGYSPPTRILNLMQKEALRNLKDAHAMNQTVGLAVLPPGSGKTRIAAEDAKKFCSKRILYVAHTHEILDVAQSEFEAVFGASKVSRHTDASTFGNLNVANIMTIQLLGRNLDSLNASSFDYVVVDEFHHAAAPSYRRLIDRIPSSTFLLGLTATPFRGDRQNILELCDDNVIVEYDLRTGIDFGILSPYHYYGCFDDVDYTSIKYRGTKYGIRDLERVLIIPERDAAIIRKWREKAEDKPTVAFCCSHRHARRFSESLIAEGIPAGVYISTTELPERKRLSKQFKDGALKVMCVVDVMNEGVDFPFVECLLFLRPTESKRIFYQQLGRGLRRYVGKSHCVILDFIGNFQNAYKIVEYHGLRSYDEFYQPAQIREMGTVREVLNLPTGCIVHFDERVIDVLSHQTLASGSISRYNIAQILTYQYRSLVKRLGHEPTNAEADRNMLLGRDLYDLVFGSWQKFRRMFRDSP